MVYNSRALPTWHYYTLYTSPHSPVCALIGCPLPLILLELMVDVPGWNAPQRQPAAGQHTTIRGTFTHGREKWSSVQCHEIFKQNTQDVSEFTTNRIVLTSVPEIVFESGQSLTFTSTAGEGWASITHRLWTDKTREALRLHPHETLPDVLNDTLNHKRLIIYVEIEPGCPVAGTNCNKKICAQQFVYWIPTIASVWIY